MQIQSKRNAKDTVFRDLFGRPEYLLQLYQALHPEDHEVTADQFTNVTIENILTDRMYNDLGFMVRDRLLILVEAQSTWSVNILVRAFMYLAQSYQEYFESGEVNLYAAKKVALPKPELYVIYTGDRQDHPSELKLSEAFFCGEASSLEVTVKILYGDDKNNIIGQYVRFCRVYNLMVKQHGTSQEAVLETIRLCRDENVLTAYLNEHEREAVTIMMALFSEEYIQKAYGKEKYDEGRNEGRNEGMLNTLYNLVSKGLLSVKDASAQAKMSEPEFRRLMAAAETSC